MNATIDQSTLNSEIVTIPIIFKFVEANCPLNDIVLYRRFEKKMQTIYANLSNRKNDLINKWEDIRPHEFTQTGINHYNNEDIHDNIIYMPKKGAYTKELDGSIYQGNTLLCIDTENKIDAGWRYRYVATWYNDQYSGIQPTVSQWSYFEYRNKIVPWLVPKYTMEEYQYTMESC